MDLAIGVPLRDPQGLTNFLQALYDPASPEYHHYLTPEQFTERFGPTTEDYQGVIDFARTNGFIVTATHSDRMLVEVSAAVSDIERAFQMNMRLYPHPTEARSFYAPDAEPSVSAEVRIADISGLNNYRAARPKMHARKIKNLTAKNTSMEGSGPNGNLIGSDYRTAYAPGVTLTGAGQILGLFEQDNYYSTDVTSYESIAGLTNPPPIQTVFVGSYKGAQSDGNGEVALDIEVAMSMAPGLSKIVCYESSTATAANSILSLMTTNTAIKQFSCSWDFTSNPRTTMDTYFQKFIAQGQSFFDASGDSGAYAGAIPEPDDDPYVTVVGGTALLTSGLGNSWSGEVTWNAPDLDDSSSGGISTTYAIPTWQAGVSSGSNGASTTHRNIPDVSMVADNIFIVADNGQNETSGGTSASSPLWAAFTALANEQALKTGHSVVGFINPAIYTLYKNSASYASTFDDITMGNDTNGTVADFYATPGYDLCTGLGSPTGISLINALVSPDDFVIAPGRGPTANGPTGGPFTATEQTFVLTNSGATSLNWSIGGVPSWLNISSQGDSLAAHSAANITASLNSFASAMVPGVYTANLWFTNLTSGLTQLRQFTLEVEQNIVHDGGFESDDFAYWTLTGVNAGVDNFVDAEGLDSTTGYTSHSGNDFAVLGEVDTLAYISQTLPTLAGQPYLISFWLAANPDGATASQFVVQWNSATSVNTLYNHSNLGSFGYENMQFLALAPSTSTTLQFGNTDNSDYLALDDVSVLPVPMPMIQAVQQTGGTVQITWNSIAGVSYQVQYNPTLLNPQWANLGNPITATGNSTTVTESIGADTQQFYRIVISALL